ncbi:MAG TPA: acyl-CoA thioesterase II [Sphingopyxis sp.]|jgi:acyl-CoA thioesterase-2|uniref:acyl-CoA thioesterase n=1 Tax=Sphingopyxis sp. TaxID=1908224 RepID=UPI002E0D4ABC|nr:acyl-CoA thioesterase II [Sphingopyxis sp.]
MTLTPDEIQARIERAREINASIDATKVVGAVARLFDLSPADEPDEFTFPALATTARERIFGGQVIAQAMVAAARTVDADKQVHSLHAYFLRGGDETKPLHFRVHRDFDGRSFANRRVVVRQDGKVIFNLTASFQLPAPGLSHQVSMPDLLPPEECREFLETIAADPNISEQAFAHMARRRPFELRNHRPPASAQATQHYQWFRVAAPIGDDQLIHRAFLAFASDMGLLSSAMLPHGLNWSTPGLFSTSLDHAMWFHNDIRVDDWFVFVMDSDWTGGSRGINRGSIYRQDGTLIASVVQEGLLRYNPTTA